MKMEEPKVNERNRCEASEVLASAPSAEKVITPTASNAKPDEVSDEVANEAPQSPSEAATDSERDDVEKSDSLGVSASDADDNTHLRLDTVIKVSSDVSSDNFRAAEEKKDDDDTTPLSPTPAEADMADMPMVVEEPMVEASVEKKDNKEGPVDKALEDLEDAIISMEADEDEEEVNEPEASNDEVNDKVDEKNANKDEATDEKPTVQDEEAGDAMPASTQSIDSDKPTGEAAVTTKPSLSMDSDRPETEAEITTKSTSMSDTAAEKEKSTKTVHFSEDTILTKDGVSKGKVTSTTDKVVPQGNDAGFFACGAFCGSTSDVADDPKTEEMESLVLKEESNTAKPSSTAAPEEVVKEESPKVIDEETTEEPVSPEGVPASVDEAAVEGATVDVDDEATVEKPKDNLDMAGAPEPAPETKDELQPSAEANNSALSAVAESAVTETKDNDDAIVEGDHSAVGLQNSATFEVQQGFSCGTVLSCGVLMPPGPPSPRKTQPIPRHLPTSLSEDPIFDLREAAERELEERAVKEESVTLSPDTEEAKAEDEEPAPTATPTPETAAQEESTEKREESEDPQNKPEANNAEESDPTLKDEVAQAEVAEINNKVAEQVEEEGQPLEKDENSTPEVLEEPSSPVPQGDAAEPAAEQPEAEPTPEKVSDDSKQLEQPAPTTSTDSKPTDPTGSPEEPVAESLPSNALVGGGLLDEDLARRAQQEAYACVPNGSCTIL